MRKILALMIAAFVALTGAVIMASPASALGKIKCDVLPTGGEDNDGDVAIRVGAFDPIVYHNVDSNNTSVAQPHKHDFFGNRLLATETDPNSLVYSDLRAFAGGSGADATSCRILTDTASYWAPSLVYTSGPKAGQRIKAKQFTAYYRGFAGQTTHSGSQALPAGARLVANDMTGYGLSGWTCGQNSRQAATQGAVNFIPDCTGEDGSPGNTLTAHVNFPSCWNGKAPNHPGDPGNTSADTEYGDTRDNADFVYPTNKTACPSTHPIEVVQLRETIQYEYVGNGSDVALTSDGSAPRGSTFHADFWNTWDQTAFVDFVQRCIRTSAEANCDP
jgi:hypothetical protein